MHPNAPAITPVEKSKLVTPPTGEAVGMVPLTSVSQLTFEPDHDVHPSPRDWRDQVLYQILIDRFDDARDDRPLFDAEKTPRSRSHAPSCRFHGGTIKGIIRRLDYIQDLGATTIWITPPLKGRQDDPYSCHGYGTQDFLAIDPRFGTLADMRELVRSAHARGMYVILDIVINHTGDVWAYKDNADPTYDPAGTRHEFGYWRKCGTGGPIEGKPAMDDAIWPVELQTPDAFKRRGRIRDFGSADLSEAVHGDFQNLKDLDLTNPQVLDALIKIYKYWIKTLDLDGFRIDTVKHCDPEPLAIFCNAIREYTQRIGKRNFLIFGEVVDGDELLQRYVANKTALEGIPERWPLLSAVLDFPLYFVLEEVIKGFTSVGALRDRYESFRMRYRDYADASAHYVTFVDNHDQMSRPYRRFGHGVTDNRQAVLAMGYLMCNLGIPCIYYGTEQGFDGAGSDDNAVRECMFGGDFGAFGTEGHHFFNTEHLIYRGTAKLIAIRNREPALRYGRQYFRDVSGDGIHFGPNTLPGGVIAFSRVLDTDEVLVVINLDDKPRDDRVSVDGNLTPPGSKMRDLLNDGPSHEVHMTADQISFVGVPLAPRSMAILKRTRT